MGSREASDVIRYALRNGAVARANGAAQRGSVRYRSTGVSLPEPRSTTAGVSFDGLVVCMGHHSGASAASRTRGTGLPDPGYTAGAMNILAVVLSSVGHHGPADRSVCPGLQKQHVLMFTLPFVAPESAGEPVSLPDRSVDPALDRPGWLIATGRRRFTLDMTKCPV
jgi:hypothetical protein